MANTTTELLASIRRRVGAPNSASTGTEDSDLLAYADEEMQLGLVPLIMATHEEYFASDLSITPTALLRTYAVPSRAIGSKMRELAFVDSQLRVTNNLVRVDPDTLDTATDGFYMRGNSIVLVSDPPANGDVLRITYFLRPSSLVDPAEAAVITAINTGTKTLTFDSVPDTFTSTATCDLINASPAFECRAIDQAVTGATSTTLVFSSALPSGLAVGDYVALAGQSPIPQIPVEFHPILAQRVAIKVLESLKDTEGLANAQAKLQEMEAAAVKLITPRVDGAPQKVFNRTSLFRPTNRWSWLYRSQ